MTTRPLLVESVSATQLQTWTECQRKAAFAYIEYVPRPQSDASKLGQEVQDTQIDPWLALGRPMDFSRPSGEIAQALVPMLPRPHAPGMEIRKKFVLPSPTGLWVYKGELDVYAPDSNIVPGLAGGVPLVGDVKTTSNLDYAKSGEALAGDIQCTTYAWETMYRTGASAVDVVWWYVRTRRKPNTVRSYARLQASQVLDEFMRTEGIARELVTAKASLPKANDLPPNVLACDMYGGCPYRHLCNLSPTVQADQVNKEPDPMNAHTNNFLDNLRKQTTPAPIAGVPPHAPAPVPPAVVPGLSPFQQMVAREAVSQGVPVPGMVPNAAPPAPVPVPVRAPAAINPPESTLPPAPPVGVSAAPVPTAPAAPPPAKRGRPTGSTNAPAALAVAPSVGISLADVEALAGLMRKEGIKRLEFDGQNVTAIEVP